MRNEGSSKGPFVEQYVLYEVDRYVKRYQRYFRPFSLLVVTAHNLTSIDEELGRSVGNSLLEDLADLINKNIREVDVWYPYARDQFVIIMEQTDSEGARTAAKRLAAEAAQAQAVRTGNDATLKLSFRTVSCPDDGTETLEILEAAGLPRVTSLSIRPR